MHIRTRLALTLGLLWPLIALAPLSSQAASTIEAGHLSVAQVKALIDGKEAVYIFDANLHESYLAGHIPGAQWVQFDEVAKAKLPAAKDAKLVFYCHNPQCGASPAAAKDALNLGYRHVWLMPEGIAGWRAAKMPVVVGAKAK
jgi:rhodanese-related sulfurtransferase